MKNEIFYGTFIQRGSVFISISIPFIPLCAVVGVQGNDRGKCFQLGDRFPSPGKID